MIAGAPLLAAMPVIAGGRGSTRSKLAAVRGYRDARRLYDTELMRELLATGAPPAKAACWDAAARPSDSERDALRAIAAILDR